MDSPNIVAGVDISRSYTGEEILDMHSKGKLRSVTLEGYCTRVDLLDNRIRFIPFWESTLFRSENDKLKTHISEDFVEVMRQDVEEQHPITRTSPQDKTARMALRIMGEVKRSGRIGGLSDDEVASIAAESWSSGEPITGEAIQKVAQHFMGTAERTNREADFETGDPFPHDRIGQ